MQIVKFARLDSSTASAFVQQMKSDSEHLVDAEFNGLPTRVLFAPEPRFPASLHYLFLPSGKTQQFHRHPGGRHLLVLGDTLLRVRHSNCDENDDPRASCVESVIEANTLAVIRFPKNHWHEFSTPQTTGVGVIAFTFHDMDDLISDRADLMKELTIFWKDEDSK